MGKHDYVVVFALVVLFLVVLRGVAEILFVVAFALVTGFALGLVFLGGGGGDSTTGAAVAVMVTGSSMIGSGATITTGSDVTLTSSTGVWVFLVNPYLPAYLAPNFCGNSRS